MGTDGVVQRGQQRRHLLEHPCQGALSEIQTLHAHGGADTVEGPTQNVLFYYKPGNEPGSEQSFGDYLGRRGSGNNRRNPGRSYDNLGACALPAGLPPASRFLPRFPRLGKRERRINHSAGSACLFQERRGSLPAQAG